MRFIYAYPETQGTDRDMLDAGPVGDVARACRGRGVRRLRVHRAPVAGRALVGVGRSPEPRPVRRALLCRGGDHVDEVADVSVGGPVPQSPAAGEDGGDSRQVVRRALRPGGGHRLLEGRVPRARGRHRRTQRAVRRGARRAADALERRTVQLQGPPLRSGRVHRTATSRAAADPDLDRREREESRANAWPSAPKDGCRCSCRRKWRRRHGRRW